MTSPVRGSSTLPSVIRPGIGSAPILLGLAALSPPLLVPAMAAPACDPRQRQTLLAPAVPGDDAVTLSCGTGLAPGDRVTRRIVLEGSQASDLELDCHGAAIGDPARPAPFPYFAVEIRSVRDPTNAARWDAPRNVVLRNCRVFGHVRVWGMGINGQGEAVKASSHSLGHTERAQAAAPRDIRILDSTLIGLGSIPLYLGPGVTGFTLQHSRITGTSSSVGLYLDAESADNVIVDNVFDVQAGRETIAVDGSARNRIAGNRIALGYHRGIDLYRNCGEGGTVRHQTPSDNVVTDNRFTYTGFLHPALVKVNARGGWRLYCGADAGYPFGSSRDNDDLGTNNQVARSVVEP